MNITTLVIDGNEYGIRFGMYSARYLADKLTSSFCFVGDEITEIGISHVVYAGYLNHCAVKDEKPVLTFENVVDFVEQSIGDTDKVKQLTDITALWVKCQFKEKEPKPAEPEAETKKKDFEEIEILAYEMGLLPDQFYRISPLEFGLMAQGYKNRQVMEMKLNRNVIYTMAKLWGSNTPNDPADFWDLGDKVEANIDEVAKLFETLREKDKEKETNG